MLLLSRNAAYRARTAVTVAVVTRTIQNIPVEVPLGAENGMPTPCVVNTDVILTIPKTALTERITTLSEGKIAQVNAAVRFALNLT